GTALTSVPWQSWLQPHGHLAELGTYFGGGTISAGTAGGQFRNPTLNGNPPFEGALVMSWLLRLPAGAPLRFGWSGSMLDGNDSSDGADMEVRINGVTYWRHTTSGGPWVPGSLDLSPWQGQTILLELVTDSRAQNFGDWPHWADLAFTAGAACAYSFAPNASIG